MLERIEKVTNILVNIFIVFTIIFGFVQININSTYTDNEHLAESGVITVYVTQQEAINATQSANNGNNDENNDSTEIDLTTYMAVSYDGILTYCTNIDSEKLLIKGTIYSVTKTSTAYSYYIADEDGNYYSIIDDTSKFPKYNKADVLMIYGVPYGISKLNGNEIPSIKVNHLELVEQ